MAALFTLTSFLAAFLLFSIQPLVARLMLPPLGGSPMVWNTAMVFFQAVLLGGYLYAHFLGKKLEIQTKKALLFHGALLLLPLFFLPIALPQNTAPPASAQPIVWLLGVLFLCAGMPFLLVSTCSPFLQRLFALSGHKDAHDPYFLYAASNLGSFGALLSYPVLLEPNLPISTQARLWMMGYFVLIALLWSCSFLVSRAPRTEKEQEVAAPIEIISWARKGKWLLLAFAPSSLMLSLTTYLSSSVAAIPLLWILPLSLYLLSFSIVFAKRQLLSQKVYARALAICILPLVIAIAAHATDPLSLLVPLHCLVFFLAAIVCHGEMARDRPSPQNLTQFYGWMALGGVLGGAFNSLLAPIIFPDVWEYPLTVALVCLLLPRDLLLDKASEIGQKFRLNAFDFLAPLILGAICLVSVLVLPNVPDLVGPAKVGLMFGLPAIVSFVFSRRPPRFALAVLFILGSGQFFYHGGEISDILALRRSFFGVHRVMASPDERFHLLSHGATMHGVQELKDPKNPVAYYSKNGPAGDVLRVLQNRKNLHIGGVGLGAGALAAYVQSGERWMFYEIDPHVAEIASDPKLFTYLSDAPEPVELIIGDARLNLKSAPDGSFDALVLDAYSSDTIPVHLLTVEALKLYESKLKPGGVLVWHLSNNHFDLEPVVGRLARETGWHGLMRRDLKVATQDAKKRVTPSQWAVLAKNETDLAPWKKLATWTPLRHDAALWTDDDSSLWPLLVRQWRDGKMGPKAH